MDNNKHENCKITIEMNGKPIFCAGWQDINLTADKNETALAFAIINKYREYLSGYVDGLKYQENISNTTI